MRRRAVILAILGAVLAVLGYTPAGGVFADLAQMLFVIDVAVFAVVLALSFGRRGARR